MTWLLGGHHHNHHHSHDDHRHGTDTGRVSSISHGNEPNPIQNHVEEKDQEEDTNLPSPLEVLSNPHSQVVPVCACNAEDPAGDLQHLQDMAEEIENYEHTHRHHWEGAQRAVPRHDNNDSESGSDDADNNNHKASSGHGDNPSPSTTSKPEPVVDQHEHKKLMRMSLNTALAIGLHNFPEGLATFVAALSDPSVGPFWNIFRPSIMISPKLLVSQKMMLGRWPPRSCVEFLCT